MNPTDADKSLLSMASATIYLVSRSIDRLYEGRQLAAEVISRCDADTSKAVRGVHPDVIELSPPEGKERIGIGQVRDIIRAAQFAPVQSDCKVCLIANAEALTIEASNALLKILEEPPRDLRFILLAEHPSDLLPTIVSRSRLIRMPIASNTQISSRLRDAGYEESHAAWLSRLALRNGELERLLVSQVNVPHDLADATRTLTQSGITAVIDACLGDDPLQRRQGLLHVLKRMASADAELLTVGIRILAAQSRESLEQFLHDLLMVAFDLLRTAQRKPCPIDPTADAVFDELGERRLQNLALALDDAHRCVAVYGPVEGILLSLFLPCEGESHDS
ncbi:hypothetical protein IH601_05470 [Candidatus Bipolaricaulota bacterium]|nr:hypothetical protein [Candidatus Bipolaricaulota bacterium]